MMLPQPFTPNKVMGSDFMFRQDFSLLILSDDVIFFTRIIKQVELDDQASMEHGEYKNML